MTHITEEHRRDLEALASGRCHNFAHYSCVIGDCPAAAIVAVNPSAPPEDGGEPEYVISPLFVSLTPAMTITGRDGREA